MGLFSGPPVRERRYNGFAATFSNPPIPAPSVASALGAASADDALHKVAIWSAVSLIASLAAEMPIDVFASSSDMTKPVSTPAYLDDIAGDGYGTPDWVYAAVVSFLLRGNVYGKVTARDSRGGFPTCVPLFHPDTVHGWRDQQSGMPSWRAGGVDVPAADMWHRRAYVVPGALQGLSPVSYHAQTIGLGMYAQQFGVEFFRDGANPTGLLTNAEQDLNADIARTAKERFIAAMNGTREPVVLGKGWQWQQISIAPEESQFLATQGYTSTECARIYGPGVPEILGYEVGGAMTYQNVEQRNIHLLTYTLDPWFSRIERALSGFLPRPRYVKLNRNALLRTDLLTRYKVHALGIASRMLAPSEARDIEDLPPMTAEQLAELDFMPAPMLNPIKVTATTK